MTIKQIVTKFFRSPFPTGDDIHQNHPVIQTFHNLGIGTFYAGIALGVTSLLLGSAIVALVGGFMLGVGFTILAMLPMVGE